MVLSITLYSDHVTRITYQQVWLMAVRQATDIPTV